MAWVDWAIVVVIALAVLGGLRQGFFRSVFSLGGLIFGLALAVWNYDTLAPIILPMVRFEPIADAIAFLLIALLVMTASHMAGAAIAKAAHYMGLGFLDRLAGGAFGFVQGVLMVTLCILMIVAFFPQTHLLRDARLPRVFFKACHLSTHVSPEDFAARVRQGLRTLEEASPGWLHPGLGNQ